MKQPIDLKELKAGDVFSESSHFTFVNKDTDGRLIFTHHGTGANIKLTTDYVSQLLNSANIYANEVAVGKEDKLWTAKQLADEKAKGNNVDEIRVGDVREKGIRTLWEEIYSDCVFTVCFQKQHTELSDKKYKELRTKQVEEAIAEIEKTATAKKGVTNKAKEILESIQNNPISKIEEGEMRILVGYKLQFESRDGKYNCMDMSINELRPVNINTIQWLVYKGVMYIVK